MKKETVTNQTNTKKSEDFYNGLNNDEIIMVFYKFKTYLDTLNSNLDKNMVTKPINTPMGTGFMAKEVPSEHIQMFKETRFYETLTNIVTKLEPVAKLIEDCDENIAELTKHLKNKNLSNEKRSSK